MKKIVVIGGGASGLVAAIFAARKGAKVTILERTNRVGKKILATGNGRCNMTNMDCHIRYFHGNNPKFALGALSTFDQNMAIQFFEELGISHKIENEGKVFPYSDQASSILDVLRMEIERLKIETLVEKQVNNIHKGKKGFQVTCADNSHYTCDALIVATGGKASPNLGSDGSGLALLEELGHHVITPFPSLVQIILKTSVVKKIKGVKIQGKVTIVAEKGRRQEEKGEILFTEDGISGPPIFQISRLVGAQNLKNNVCQVYLDLFPDHTLEELQVMLQMRVTYQPHRSLGDFLIGLVNKRLIVQILKEAGLKDINRTCNTLSDKEIMKLVQVFKGWNFTAVGTRSWPHAQVMAGGISTGDVNPKTLESKKVPGLYITGELLDIDGDCGGFNLQWAWSTAYVAGSSAANE
ncbi:MAG TPA: NAD(P)/FAD-dependent oxidoreductase [Epulopiscium sp.]|nr:NAD(P)/FAD-dependent oxidoreductase [Candidatus Epulonipiscium sp.]